MVQLRENVTKNKLSRGEVVTVIDGYLTPHIIDAFGPLGFDAAWIDAEHGAPDFGDLPDLTRACDLWGITPLVRVNLNIPSVIYRTLDAGAQGIIVPRVNTAEDARAAVQAAKFHPIGSRGYYPGRQGYGVDDYYSTVNDQTMIAVQIEETLALTNLTEILKVEHIDVFLVTAGDLSQSMGHLDDVNHPEVVSAIGEAIEQITKAGKAAGIVGYESILDDFIGRGARFILTSWPLWVKQAASRYLKLVETAYDRAKG